MSLDGQARIQSPGRDNIGTTGMPVGCSMINSAKSNDGLILILALWILAIVSLLCIGLAHRVVINLKLVDFQKDRMQCLYIAKAAIQKASSVLEQDDTPDTDALNELWSRGYDQEAGGDGYIFKEVEVGNGMFSISYAYDDKDGESPVNFYGMSDEDRKININQASRELLVSLFDIIGFQDPESLGENIIYWRGDVQRGYDDPYYVSSEIPYPARKAPLRTINELSLVKGFRENPELIEECERFLTVHTTSDAININTASWQVLKAVFVSLGSDRASLGLSDRLVNNIIDFRNGVDNQEATDDDVVFTIVEVTKVITASLTSITEQAWGSNQAFPFTVKSNLFRIEVIAGLNTSKVKKKITAVIFRDNGLPCKVKYWYEE
ncbi:general secretion pathway protein GspK [Candidatus Omnitrophota bacterium]